MRIWYQSGAPLGKMPLFKPYEDALKRHLQSVVRIGTVVDAYGIEIISPVFNRSNYVQYLDAAHWISNARTAEQQGYDAFAGGCMLDTGSLQIREVIDIPAAFSAETSFHFACLLARKFSILSYEQWGLFQMEELVKQYGLLERYVPGSCLSITMEQLADGFSHPAPIIEAVKKGARRAIEGGAGILVSGCNILTMILVDSNVREIDSVPVLNNVGIIVKFAELLVDMKEIGVTRSKKGFYASLSKDELALVRRAHGLE
jgi:Asp/Glu/hydantoin racemase